MKPQSAKAKGRRLQQQVAAAVLENYRELTEDDVRSTSMGAPGVDVQLSTHAQQLFPYAVECKACERINVYSAWDQCVRNRGTLTPLLVLRKNRGETLAVVSLDHFLTLQAAPEAPLPEAPLPEAPTELASDALAQLTTALAQAREAAERLGTKLH